MNIAKPDSSEPVGYRGKILTSESLGPSQEERHP